MAFPLGGIGAGMICIEGTGGFSHVSLRHRPDVDHEPMLFSAIYGRGEGGEFARVLEGPVPAWKIFGTLVSDTAFGPGNGLPGKHYGLPRFAKAEFDPSFPFATVTLRDDKLPVAAAATAWSPFVPPNADDSSLPVAGVEYTFENVADAPLELVYSFHASQFMATPGSETHRVDLAPSGRGFALVQPADDGRPWDAGAFLAEVDAPDAAADCAWFRGGWFDPLSMVWNAIEAGRCEAKAPYDEGKPSPGGSVYVPLSLQPGEKRTVRVSFAWYVPDSDLSVGVPKEESAGEAAAYYRPWYAGKFGSVGDVALYWAQNYDRLRTESERFTSTFFGTTVPEPFVEAAAANLSILKSPTVLRQTDGRLWGWEGCHDDRGCCHGSCTHVWNYAHAVPHLFPALERTLRDTAFVEGQDERGHQNFRVPLPIRPVADHGFHAAADGQLGEIMKAYREWRVSGDDDWMRSLWPRVESALEYCIATWDPDGIGVLIEPHHNTYDIEFWGPDGMCSSVYLGALKAGTRLAEAFGARETADRYEALYRKGKAYLEDELFNGEYFEQKIVWEGLRAKPPEQELSFQTHYSPEALELLQREGPKYQYGKGCLSDGVIGAWLAEMCGLGDILDREKVRSHLLSVYRYNFKRELTEHANPQRPGYALGDEGGLLLCTWPRGGRLSLPFVYSNEVWTGIEYQVASHLLSLGCEREALDIVEACRSRYDGSRRNPYNEYECGHWYARAMASYALLQGWSGVRYDAVERTLYVPDRGRGDYSCFLAAAGGYGIAGLRGGVPFFDCASGAVPIDRIAKA
ncbi:GH116 family glycosyl hydrolase [Paenibacillus sp.]|uniref:GH116 family glycosyl hydrolase n=1 Tax=Paenibacillus sp. TaxID=58172 RepID=UPI002D383D3A|nr:GH116 family glycosyl hydrolase [Paenibacillus sp.]HZG56041.1 GH116 family glycosyl hydrolase [Paenibacillus sp.]